MVELKKPRVFTLSLFLRFGFYLSTRVSFVCCYCYCCCLSSQQYFVTTRNMFCLSTSIPCTQVHKKKQTSAGVVEKEKNLLWAHKKRQNLFQLQKYLPTIVLEFFSLNSFFYFLLSNKTISFHFHISMDVCSTWFIAALNTLAAVENSDRKFHLQTAMHACSIGARQRSAPKHYSTYVLHECFPKHFLYVNILFAWIFFLSKTKRRDKQTTRTNGLTTSKKKTRMIQSCWKKEWKCIRYRTQRDEICFFCLYFCIYRVGVYTIQYIHHETGK